MCDHTCDSNGGTTVLGTQGPGPPPDTPDLFVESNVVSLCTVGAFHQFHPTFHPPRSTPSQRGVPLGGLPIAWEALDGRDSGQTPSRLHHTTETSDIGTSQQETLATNGEVISCKKSHYAFAQGVTGHRCDAGINDASAMHTI
jgi:hypothetical protein